MLEPLANLAILVSVVGALALACALAALIGRRMWVERHSARHDAHVKAVIRALLARIGAAEGSEAVPVVASRAEKLEAVVGLYQLVRGREREFLDAFVAEEGLLDPIIRAARRGSKNRRVEAVRQLEWVAADQAVATLRTVLASDSDMIVRLEAAAALAQLDELPDVPDLMAALQMGATPITRMHRAIFRVAARQDHVTLTAYLDGDLPAALRALIVDSLGWADDYAVLPALGDAARHPDADVRCAALRAAQKVGHPAALDWVTLLLDDADDNVRALALRTCSHLGAYRAADRIEAMRDDPSPWVRFRANRALRQMAIAA